MGPGRQRWYPMCLPVLTCHLADGGCAVEGWHTFPSCATSFFDPLGSQSLPLLTSSPALPPFTCRCVQH